MTPKSLLTLALLFIAVGCQPKATSHTVVTLRSAPHLVTIAIVKRKDLDRAARALGRHNITFSLDTDNNPKVHIMVDPRDQSAAIEALYVDPKETKSKSK